MLSLGGQEYFYLRLGELIKSARVNAGMSQEQLASFLNLTRVSIVNIEKGRQKVQVHTLIEIVRHLNLPIGEFFEILKNASSPELSPKLQKELSKKVDPSKVEEFNRIKEFIGLSISKK